MGQRILVINPNSSERVTRDIDAAVEGLRFQDGPAIDCTTMAEGPPGIENQVQVDSVILPLLKLAERESNRTSAFVIACFSDPGIYSLRERLEQPVLGIAESGFSIALTRGERFGIISILGRSIPRHRRYVASLGLSGRFAGDRAVGLKVSELREADRVTERLAHIGSELRQRDGADVLVLGCAGMAGYRQALQEHVGIPVVDPTQAAVGLALTALRSEAET
ncbi:MAG TPA: aspartate/glutamate racemase family protein [Candidatus Udaeobacter sp.]|nr:aspartate/glutamate racemase family protein [Candidatus Udaeobacter sp.]